MSGEAAERVPRDSLRGAALAAGVTGLMCLATLWELYGPFGAWARYPLAYTDAPDSLFNLWVVKTVLETGWFVSNPALGAPFGANVLDFARPEVLFLLTLRGAGLFTSNVVLIHNLFYFAGFFLVAWSALFVLRRELRISWPLAVAGALAFSWLPYHFARIAHLFLSTYLAVPVATALMLRVSSDRPPFFEQGRLRLAHPGIWLALALVACTSIYYAFFAIVFIAAEGAIGSMANRSVRPAWSALLLVACIVVFLLLALSLSLRHRATEGINDSVASRSLGESDRFALRPLHLLLPYENHRFEWVGQLARTYTTTSHDHSENSTAALGLIGAAGFLLLLAQALTGNRVLPDAPATAVLARANLVAILLSVVGGGGTLIALVVSPQFRSLNRVSVFIAFFSIAALMTAIDRAVDRLGSTRRGALLIGIAGALVVVAFVDQAPSGGPPLGPISRVFDNDRAFVGRVEQMLPDGAMVYQAPYTAFPEVAPFYAEPAYSPLRAYIHSRHLRWSYGGMKGRPGDYWNRAVARLPMAERVALLRRVGFSAIVLDRQAFPDHGEAYEKQLVGAGAADMFDSADGTLAFHPLPEASSGQSPAETLLPAPGAGFLAQEGTYPDTWAWTSGDAEMLVYHFGAKDLPVALTCALRSDTARRVTVSAGDGSGASASLTDPSADVPLRLQVVLQPGWNVVRFTTDQPPARLSSGTDLRRVAFRVRDLRLTSR